jgi:hypothetical protein
MSCGLSDQNDLINTNAYNFILKSQDLREYSNEVQHNLDLKDKPKLYISSSFRENSPYPCLCDILKKRYKIKETCTVEIGLDRPTSTKASDSIKLAYTKYSPNKVRRLPFKHVISGRKKGIAITFSDVYQNSLTAEVFGFHYDNQDMLMGKSLIFYFTFKSSGEIESVFLGETHYN